MLSANLLYAFNLFAIVPPKREQCILAHIGYIYISIIRPSLLFPQPLTLQAPSQ